MKLKRSEPPTGLLLATLAMCFAMGWAATALAQEAVPIKVVVKIESDSLNLAWGQPRIDQIESQLSDSVLASISGLYAHWDFRKSVGIFYATVRLVVSETERNKIRIGMEGQKKNQAVSESLWNAVWLMPADIVMGRMPQKDNGAVAISEKFSAMFGPGQKQIVRKWLEENVPIGARGNWQGQSPVDLQVVTGLSWDRFSSLKRSRFKLVCKRQMSEIVLESKGTGASLEYSSQDPPKSYTALVVRPEDVESQVATGANLTAIREYGVRQIFLIEEISLVDDEFFNFGS